MNWRNYGSVAVGIALAAIPVLAHHPIEASFDSKKPVTLKGMVMKYEWTNPHVYLYLDVTERGRTSRWEVEFDSTLDLQRVGWTPDSVKIGDNVTADGIAARDGSRLISGKTLTIPGGKKLAAAPPDIQAAPKSTAKATPRWPDGHPRLGVEPGQRGYWTDPNPAGLVENGAGNIRMNRAGLLANIADAGKVAPFHPWAKALYEYRQKALLKDDPMAFCLPPGGPRQFQDRYGIQIVEQPDRQRIFVMSGGGNRNWRLINLDGRALPDIEEVTPTYYGYSVGKWEGDTLVLNTQAFTERFWFSNGGLPHTENLKLTERISRPDSVTLRYEVTVNDPGAYTRPWTGGWNLAWVPNADLEEYFCDENNKETDHLSGKHQKGE